jgi:hypothetical protein
MFSITNSSFMGNIMINQWMECGTRFFNKHHVGMFMSGFSKLETNLLPHPRIMVNPAMFCRFSLHLIN